MLVFRGRFLARRVLIGIASQVQHLVYRTRKAIMLVLTRKLQEKIHIGDNITLTIVKVKGNTVRLGIEAPREVRIVRGELPPREEAAQTAPAEKKAPAAVHTLTLPLELAGALAEVVEAGAADVDETSPARKSAARSGGPLANRLRASSASAV